MSKNVIAIIGIIVIIVGLGIIIRRGTGSETTNLANNLQTSASSSATTQTAPLPNSPTKMYTQATLKTNFGDIVITLNPTLAPKTVENFTKLAASGFYNGVKFHRVIKGFMDQTGDPLSKDDSKSAMWGTGGPGYKFDDEIGPASKNVKGSVAMANAGPNTNGSQFFINVADNAFLDGKYNVFGQVTTGYDVAEKINNVKTDPSNDRPIDPVVVQSVELK
jgi:cyclophilin family peptidyl-prolyl cis-trans isomerase